MPGRHLRWDAWPPPLRSPRGLRLTRIAALVTAAGLLACVLGLLLTGATDALTVDDAGAITRWGLPVARVLNDVAASLTVGLLVLAAVALPAGPGRRSRGSGSPTSGVRHAPSPVLDGPSLAVVRLAGATALVWAAAGAAVLVLSYARLSGVAPGAPGFAEQLGRFLTEIDLLRALLISSARRRGRRHRRDRGHPAEHGRLDGRARRRCAAAGRAHRARRRVDGPRARRRQPGVPPRRRHGLGRRPRRPHAAARRAVRRGPRRGRRATLLDPGAVGVRRGRRVRRGQRLAAAGRLVRAVHPYGAAGHRQGRRARAARRSPGSPTAAAPSPRMSAGSTGAQPVRDGSQAAFWRLVAGELVVMGFAIGVAVALANSAPPRPEDVGGDRRAGADRVPDAAAARAASAG